MAEQCIKGKWKVKEKKVSKINTPMIGIVYSTLFKGKEVLGVLERVGGSRAMDERDDVVYEYEAQLNEIGYTIDE